MQVLQRTFCVILICLSVLTRVSPISLKERTNTTVNDEFRHPTFVENLLNGLARAEMISGLSGSIPIVEVRNMAALGPEGGTDLNEFRTISVDVIITGTLVPYNSQRVTLYGNAHEWGSWATSLVDFHDVDAATARREFEWDQIVMDEEEAYAILRKTGFNGPWICIYLCKLWATGMLFYVFQQPRHEGSLDSIYQFVGVEDRRVKLFRGAVQQPCTQLELALTMNVTFQAEPANQTNLQVSPSGSTNVTSQNAFEVDGELSESITAF